MPVDDKPPPSTPSAASGSGATGTPTDASPRVKQFPDALLIAFVRHIHSKSDGMFLPLCVCAKQFPM